MYKVQMKYMDANDMESPVMFDCQHCNFENNSYQFKNVVIDNFVIEDFEVNHDDIASIRII